MVRRSSLLVMLMAISMQYSHSTQGVAADSTEQVCDNVNGDCSQPGALNVAGIKRLVASRPVVVFSKSYCPYCKRAKDLLNNLGVKYVLHELDEMEHGQEVQSDLAKVTGRRSVPQVFIGGKFIGGSDDTLAAHEKGLLAEYLAEAGVPIQEVEYE